MMLFFWCLQEQGTSQQNNLLLAACYLGLLALIPPKHCGDTIDWSENTHRFHTISRFAKDNQASSLLHKISYCFFFIIVEVSTRSEQDQHIVPR